jgi:hypothetical protein
MSQSLSTVQQTEFDELVKIEYRSKGNLLAETMRVRPNVLGAFVQFRKVGQIIAMPHAFQNTINLQDPGYSPQTATLVKYMTGTAVDDIQELTVNFDAKQELAMLTVEALNRRKDQVVIDLLAANPFQTIANGGTGFTYAKWLQVVSVFVRNGVPIPRRYIALTGSQLREILADDHFTSRLYTSNELISRGTAAYADILSMNVIEIPDMTEGGLPLAGNVRTILAWGYDAAGLGIGADRRVKINFLPREDSWLVAGTIWLGGTVVDNRGVIAVQCVEA